MNIRLLKSKLIEQGLTQKDLAEIMKLSPSTLNRKINDPRNIFVLRELLILKDILKLSDEEAIAIFFRD